MRTGLARHMCVAATLLLVHALPAWGRGKESHSNSSGSSDLRAIQHWNQVAIDASGLDHTEPLADEDRDDFAEQLGPGRSARAMAIVHIAMFDAVNAIAGGYQSYTDLPRVGRAASMPAAIAQAAHDTLVALFPAQTASYRRGART